LNLVNFFLAEVVGVIIPFLSDFLKEHNWRYDSVGIAVAAAGLGTLIFQTPAGIISDKVWSRRLLLGCASILLGICYGFLPSSAEHPLLLDSLLFISGMAAAFFVPLLAALALSLVGHRHLDRMMGINQSWNHAGNIAAALLALLLVRSLGIESIFFVMASISLLAAASLFLIRGDELNPNLSRAKNSERRDREHSDSTLSIRELFSDNRVKVVLISVALFHIANAPVMPLVALYLKDLGGGDDKVAMVVLIAQAVMVPVSWLAGKYCASVGRKPVFAFAFLILPIRIFLYSITSSPSLLLAIQSLDGIGAGIYGVVIAIICSDLTIGKAGFNSLMGMAQTALAMGGFFGPLIAGFLTQHLGFSITFTVFAGIAAFGAGIFIWRMPETKNS
jgi:MFS family permease